MPNIPTVAQAKKEGEALEKKYQQPAKNDDFEVKFFNLIRKNAKRIEKEKNLTWGTALLESAKMIIDEIEADGKEMLSEQDYSEYEAYKQQLIKNGKTPFEASLEAGQKFGG